MLKIAHRGYNAKDNTKKAFQNAIDAQFDMIELDLHITLEDILIITHDLFLGPHNVEKTDIETLQKYEPELLTFEQYISYFPPSDIKLYIDLKGSDHVATRLVEFMKNKNICCTNVVVASFNRYHIQALSYSYLDWKIGFITSNTFLDFEYDLLLNNCDFISVHWPMLSCDLINSAQKSKKRVFVFTCDSKEVNNHIIQYPIDGIVSDIFLS